VKKEKRVGESKKREKERKKIEEKGFLTRINQCIDPPPFLGLLPPFIFIILPFYLSFVYTVSFVNRRATFLDRTHVGQAASPFFLTVSVFV
jgi:hypothetical protein